MSEVKRYEEGGINKFFRWSALLVSIGLSIYVMPPWIKSTINDYYQQNWKDFYIGIFLIGIYPIFVYALIATFIEFYTVAVKVELTEDRIIGYPWYGKKRFEIRYDEIEIIKDRSNIFPLSAITLMGNGKKFYMSVLVYPLANVVEYIEGKAINLKESRLKRLKRDPSLWVYGKEEENG